MAGYVPAFVCGKLPTREASTFYDKKDEFLRFHRIFLLFDSSKPFFFFDVLHKDK